MASKILILSEKVTPLRAEVKPKDLADLIVLKGVENEDLLDLRIDSGLKTDGLGIKDSILLSTYGSSH